MAKFQDFEGVQVKIEFIPAMTARELLDDPSSHSLLDYAFVRHEGVWAALSDDHVANEVFTSWETLASIESAVYERNFAFLKDWKPTPTPAGMGTSFVPLHCQQIDPLFSALIGNGLANYNELKTIYCLEDAFKLLEVLTVKKVNEFLANSEVNK